MSKKGKKVITITLLGFLYIVSPIDAHAGWQQTLESNFDIAETFDELKDWGANGLYPSGSGDSRAYDPALLPKKIDGSASRWGYWNNKYPTAIVGAINNGPFQTGETVTNGLGANWEYRQTYVIDGVTYIRLQDAIYGQSVGAFQVGHTIRGLASGATATITAWPKIIADHGTNKWRSEGKSLMMNLGDNDNADGAMAGIGAQRLGMFLGDGATGKSGYKKVHVFMMVKFAPTYFGASGNQADIDYVRVFKFVDVCSGFTRIDEFGTPAEQQFIEQTAQTATEYGANCSVVNVNGGGLSNAGRAWYTEIIATATPTPDIVPPSIQTYYGKSRLPMDMFNNDVAYQSRGADFNTIYDTGKAAGEWIGLEIIMDIGTTNASNGSTELFIYDKQGVVRGHFTATGLSKLVYFDHYYNKITLGGNRRTGPSTSNTDGRYWVDDFIVDDARIGLKYFAALAASQGPVDGVAPSVPTGLSVH
ncbi:TPA: hypothetical protein DDZ49_03555 [Candidatus Wolfebacteria bacterium]|uniref:Uncharacterized protein n=1 Tax=Candidatus Wolfebacteria bacterium GW2011_GWB1_47_1 TaxID=1619007 RepID=A0A0G4AR49_9BACT|nr:MAG: hypothetical protein UX70_C0001G0299 [Candidatus Wolfebacteria bacterium GW2011_GWB1_47_1]KKU41062.1 MAG: hypothetical protein UX58_C0011G0003 [Candidatus Wolfebacteria bacterium GW2011_GWB2_46_69]KKU53270.1 MAG: hypothetical protein UX76_C0019G0029 [Candidatus Wolfebacteria bacterium GW2011_GWC1_47_103]KKU59109.1 MAG: hypothetical protein UX83_C0008G0059 [Candidatus Wolfebacteria bacterium GW2011_GWE2_47_12]KKU65684.1 MAG: hypothetical protein UX90_C0002G0060 [Candidatus Wolfebacteria 